MKKKIYYLLTFLITLLALINNVSAAKNGVAMWLECDYEYQNNLISHLEGNRPIVLFSGHDKNGASHLDYRMLSKNWVDPEMYSWGHIYGATEHNPRFDYCWIKDVEDINDSCTSTSTDKYTEDEAKKMIRNGVCPAKIRPGKWTQNDIIVFAGISNSKENKVYHLDSQYRVYRNNNSDEKVVIAYDENGLLVYAVNGEIKNSYYTEIQTTANMIRGDVIFNIQNNLHNFFKLAETESGFLFFDHSIFTPNEGTDILFDSKNNIHKLHNELDKWYQSTAHYVKTEALEKINTNHKETIKYCRNLNSKYNEGKKYYFTGNYSAQQLTTDLLKLYDDLKSYYNSPNQTEYDNYVGGTTTSHVFSAYNYTIMNLLGSLDYIPTEAQDYILSDIDDYLVGKGLNTEKNPDEILKDTLHCLKNLYDNTNIYHVDLQEMGTLISKYTDLGASRGIRIDYIHNCEALLGEALIKKINSYLNIIKIVAPIIIIAFAIIDFTKAIFQGDDEMKKAQQGFIKRIFIAIILFFTPTLVNLILTIANQVWSYVSPNNCGLF